MNAMANIISLLSIKKHKNTNGSSLLQVVILNSLASIRIRLLTKLHVSFIHKTPPRNLLLRTPLLHNLRCARNDCCILAMRMVSNNYLMNLLTVLPHLHVTNATDIQGYDLSFIVTAKMKTLIFFTDVSSNLLDNIVMRNYTGIIWMIVGTQLGSRALTFAEKSWD